MTSLVVIPTYITSPEDLDVVQECLASLKRTADADVLVVDDGSPATDLVDALEGAQAKLGFELVRKPDNEGFSATVNVGLRRALETGQDVVLCNADIQFTERGWLQRMLNTTIPDRDELASVVGALLLYPNGLVQHAGVFFSLLTRGFDHSYKFAPGNLPNAQTAKACPVTGALQLIRNECLQAVGVYDDEFRLGYEDMDYCIRVFKSGRFCVYNPHVRAIHHESLFRGRKSEKLERWQAQSYLRLCDKYAEQSFAGFVPLI